MLYPITMKPWGMEILFINTDLYCYKMIVCVHQRWSSNGLYHYHKLKDETFFVIKGKLLLDIPERKFILNPKETRRLKPYTPHKFRSINNSCIFYEISTHDSIYDSIRIPHYADIYAT